MKLVYTNFFGCSLSDPGDRRFSILLPSKTNREQKYFSSSIVINLTSSNFYNINVSGDNRLRNRKADTLRGFKMIVVWCRKTREIIWPIHLKKICRTNFRSIKVEKNYCLEKNIYNAIRRQKWIPEKSDFLLIG